MTDKEIVEVKTINIPIDEYFDLRMRADMNGILMERLGQFEGRLFDIDRRIYELEQNRERR